LVGYARRNFFVPIPRVQSFEELNLRLQEQCHKRRARRLRGHEQSIGERFERDRQAFLALPATPYDACDKVSSRATSLSLVRYRSNDYSVPTAYGHRQVLVKGYVDNVVICCGMESIARHPRCYEREQTIYDPLHYLALLEHKTNALEQAAPLQKWELPAEFAQIRHLLEVRQAKRGTREYIQVLRLLECFPFETVVWAIRKHCDCKRSPSMRSSTWCCAVSSAGRHVWISRCIRICLPLRSRSLWPPSTYHC
jgi:hypothetical protein